jgi:hypothetical protein
VVTKPGLTITSLEGWICWLKTISFRTKHNFTFKRFNIKIVIVHHFFGGIKYWIWNTKYKLQLTIQLSRGIPFVNRFNSAIFLCLSQARSQIFIRTIHCLFCVQWFKVRGSCLYYVTIFHCSLGRSHKTGLTVYQYNQCNLNFTCF